MAGWWWVGWGSFYLGEVETLRWLPDARVTRESLIVKAMSHVWNGLESAGAGEQALAAGSELTLSGVATYLRVGPFDGSGTPPPRSPQRSGNREAPDMSVCGDVRSAGDPMPKMQKHTNTSR